VKTKVHRAHRKGRKFKQGRQCRSVTENDGGEDPASKVRQQKRDPLGRLTQVIEDPNDLNPNGLNYSTTYSYDALDNGTDNTRDFGTPSGQHC